MKDFGKVILVSILVFSLLIGVWFGYLKLLKPALNLKREAVQTSQQYVESKQSMLMQMTQEYNASEDPGQRALLAERMKLESIRIPDDQIPQSIKTILKENR